jgi:competence protein ComEC
VGFALSVVATAALLLIAPWWRERLSRWLPVRVAEPLAVATVAHLATAPLVAAISGRVSLVAVAANLAAEPAVVIVTVCGAVATVVSPLSATLARWCAWPAGWGAWWVAEVARSAAAMPGADVDWPSGPWGIATLGVLALAALLRGPAALERLGVLLLRPGADRGEPRAEGAWVVGDAWHASTDVDDSNAPGPRHPRGGPRGPPRRARRGPGRHRRPGDRR